MRYRLLFTLDYEIHGNGDGDPWKLMVEPTARLMDLLEKYGRKLTIMADVAEILSFKNYYLKTGEDFFHVTQIEDQLREAIRRGHDVQLHIHSSWFKAVWNGKKWDQFIDEYNMAALTTERIDEMVGKCVHYLEGLLTPIKPDYKVWLFRAANWSMMPTESIYKVLIKYGISADSSVYKGGVQGGNVCYDYREAHHNLLCYPASSSNINYLAPDNQESILIEYPIYTEMRPFWAFISPMRFFRMIRAKFHRHKKSSRSSDSDNRIHGEDNRRLTIKSLFRNSPWKLDFNQATGRQLISAMKRILKQPILERETVDVVFIGHSKSFIPYNGMTFERFLRWLSSYSNFIDY